MKYLCLAYSDETKFETLTQRSLGDRNRECGELYSA